MNTLLLLALINVDLRQLTATSGSGVDAVLDGNDKTGFSPPGNAQDEGITFVFEAPTAVTKVKLSGCSGEALNATVFCDGVWSVDGSCGQPSVSTIFVRLEEARACLGEVRFFKGNEQLAVKPPRQVPATLEASSTLAPEEAFHPSFLVDGRLNFGWAEGAASTGEGESVTIRFDKPQTITAVEIWNGYQRSPDHFAKNARVKSLKIASESGAQSLTLADKDGAQKLTLDKPLSGKALTLTVESVYPGTKYKDLVISELRLFDTTGPFIPSTRYREERQRTFAAQQQKTAAALVLDTPLSTQCASESGHLKLRSNASFIASFEELEEADATTEKTKKRLVEGAWVPSPSDDPAMLVFDLYAKQYVVRSTVRQYGKNTKKESVGIIGGKHRLYDFAKMSDTAFTDLLAQLKKNNATAFACGSQRTRADFAKDRVVFIAGPVFNDFFRRAQ